MNQEQVTLLLIKGAIADLPETDRKGIELAAANLREIITLHNDHGLMAMALVGAELATQE